MIGAGPLGFFRDPGKTGLELSAMHRIQEIYRRYGFRTSAGEGAEPYGLERYGKAFFAAWRYRHRAVLGIPGGDVGECGRGGGAAVAVRGAYLVGGTR